MVVFWCLAICFDLLVVELVYLVWVFDLVFDLVCSLFLDFDLGLIWCLLFCWWVFVVCLVDYFVVIQLFGLFWFVLICFAGFAFYVGSLVVGFTCWQRCVVCGVSLVCGYTFGLLCFFCGFACLVGVFSGLGVVIL